MNSVMNIQSPMMQQITSIPDLMHEMKQSLQEEAERIVNTYGVGRFDHILITGCGDSYCAALAAKYVFLKYTDCQVDAVSTVDLSRCIRDQKLAGTDCAVIAVSYSGRVERIIELCKRVRALGGFVLGITGNPESGLYKNASVSLRLDVPSFASSPGIRSYCACLSALYDLAFLIGSGQKSSRKPLIQSVRDEIDQVSGEIPSAMAGWDKAAGEFIPVFKQAGCIEIIGSGVSYATACFGAAKELETAGKPVMVNNTEDWFHTSFFLKDVLHTPLIMISNKRDGDHSRCRELILTAEQMGRDVFCITDDPELNCSRKLMTPFIAHAGLHALFQYMPLAILFAKLGEELGELYFRGGRDNWSACVNCATLTDSEEEILKISEED